MTVRELIDKLLEACENPNNSVVIKVGDLTLDIEEINLSHPDGWYGQVSLEAREQ